MSDLAISIINTNNKYFLKQCLESIFKQVDNINYDIDVFVIDNASADGSADMIKKDFPQAKLILNNKRLGFSVNHNKVLKTADARFKMILNEDLILREGMLKNLLDFAERHKGMGAVGPRMIFGNGSFQHSAFYPPSLKSELCKIISPRLFSNKARGIFSEEKCKNLFTPESLRGACILFNNKALSEIGYLDERFFIYYEDADICKRLSDAGWKIYYYPHAEVVHYHGKSQKGELEYELISTYYISCIYYFLKHKGLIQAFILGSLLLAIDTLKICKWAFLFLFFRKKIGIRNIERKMLISWREIKTFLFSEYPKKKYRTN